VAARDALLVWAAEDPETPMDVDPDQSPAEAVLELERSVQDPGAFFESVPVVVFADKGRRSARLPASPAEVVPDDDSETDDESEPKPKPGVPLWAILVPAALGVMCVGACLMGLLIYLLKG
jgi:hypothetical protein